MLILMGGGNIIKSKISAHIEADLEVELGQKGFEPYAFLFLGAYKQCHSFIKSPDIREQSCIAGIGSTLAQSRDRDRQGLVELF
jgi:hypothetical protein